MSLKESEQIYYKSFVDAHQRKYGYIKGAPTKLSNEGYSLSMKEKHVKIHLKFLLNNYPNSLSLLNTSFYLYEFLCHGLVNSGITPHELTKIIPYGSYKYESIIGKYINDDPDLILQVPSFIPWFRALLSLAVHKDKSVLERLPRYIWKNKQITFNLIKHYKVDLNFFCSIDSLDYLSDICVFYSRSYPYCCKYLNIYKRMYDKKDYNHDKYLDIMCNLYICSPTSFKANYGMPLDSTTYHEIIDYIYNKIMDKTYINVMKFSHIELELLKPGEYYKYASLIINGNYSQFKKLNLDLLNEVEYYKLCKIAIQNYTASVYIIDRNKLPLYYNKLIKVLADLIENHKDNCILNLGRLNLDDIEIDVKKKILTALINNNPNNIKYILFDDQEYLRDIYLSGIKNGAQIGFNENFLYSRELVKQILLIKPNLIDRLPIPQNKVYADIFFEDFKDNTKVLNEAGYYFVFSKRQYKYIIEQNYKYIRQVPENIEGYDKLCRFTFKKFARVDQFILDYIPNFLYFEDDKPSLYRELLLIYINEVDEIPFIYSKRIVYCFRDNPEIILRILNKNPAIIEHHHLFNIKNESDLKKIKETAIRLMPHNVSRMNGIIEDDLITLALDLGCSLYHVNNIINNYSDEKYYSTVLKYIGNDTNYLGEVKINNKEYKNIVKKCLMIDVKSIQSVYEHHQFFLKLYYSIPRILLNQKNNYQFYPLNDDELLGMNPYQIISIDIIKHSPTLKNKFKILLLTMKRRELNMNLLCLSKICKYLTLKDVLH